MIQSVACKGKYIIILGILSSEARYSPSGGAFVGASEYVRLARYATKREAVRKAKSICKLSPSIVYQVVKLEI